MDGGGMTVGFVIVSSVPVEGRLLPHERHHVRQSMVWGPLFVPAYLLLAIPYGYRRHPMEVGVATGPSSPGRRPFPPARGRSRWDTMPRSAPAKDVRTSRCCCGGNRSRMRLIVSVQSIVWRVEITRGPVSAAWIPGSAGSGARISPTRI